MTAAAVDGEEPAHARLRPARWVQIGWHVRVDGRFLLVAKVAEADGQVNLWFSDDSMLGVGGRVRLWVRTPADQIAYMSSVLPMHTGPEHYVPPRRRPMATPFSGSAPERCGPG